jgi:hypothetical protein
LGAIFKRFLTRQYSLAPRKKWQCAGTAALAFALPFLAWLPHAPAMTWLAAAWAGAALGSSTIILFLAMSAYRQHFARHRGPIWWTRGLLLGERIQKKFACFELRRVNRKLDAIGQRQGNLPPAQEDPATARVNALKAERDALQAEVAGYATAMDEHTRIQREETAVIAQLKGQRLVIQ